MLNQLFSNSEHRIAIAGSHGKTTTSGMISHVLLHSDRDPNFIIGSALTSENSSYRCGNSTFFVIEADESDGSFLDFNTTALVLLNLGEDHMSFFKTKAVLHSYFKKIIQNTLLFNGTIYINADDTSLMSLLSNENTHSLLFYGIDSGVGIHATQIKFHTQGTTFTVLKNDKLLGQITLSMFGRHNIYNALATLTCLLHHGLSFTEIKAGLASFKGTHRRMSCIGIKSNISIYDDYAHHPTEIKSTLSGLKQSLNQRIICIFQPHRYTRLRDFFTEFTTSFSDADCIIVTDVYSAGEPPIPKISSDHLVKQLQRNHSGQVYYIPSLSDVSTRLVPLLKAKDIVVTMGAGDIFKVAEDLLKHLS